MGMNQIINMIMRIIMRKAINSGINAGIKKVSRGRNQPKTGGQRYDDPMLDDGEFDTDAGPSQAEVRRQRQAKRAARQAGKSAGRGGRA